jgi:hypothetical protein
MDVSRKPAAMVALAASALLLAGCAATPAAEPVSQAERVHIKASILEVRWTPLKANYPEAFRPDIPVTHTVTDHDWAGDVVDCLRSRGYTAEKTNVGYTYGASQGQSSLEFTIADYICTSTWVKQSSVQARLSVTQQLQLELFQVDTLRPCLLLAGVRSAPPPTDLQVGGLTGLAGWNPYDLAWKSGMSTRSLSFLERRCPPIPSWLDLAT